MCPKELNCLNLPVIFLIACKSNFFWQLYYKCKSKFLWQLYYKCMQIYLHILADFQLTLHINRFSITNVSRCRGAHRSRSAAAAAAGRRPLQGMAALAVGKGGGRGWEGQRPETGTGIEREGVVRQGGGRRGRGAAAGHGGALLARADLGMEARAAAAGRSWSLLSRLGSGMEAQAAAAVKSGRLDLGRAPPARRRFCLGGEEGNGERGVGLGGYGAHIYDGSFGVNNVKGLG
jgi:hypothetical protein